MSLSDARIVVLSSKPDTTLIVDSGLLLSRMHASVAMGYMIRQDFVGILQQHLACHPHSALGHGALAIIALAIQGPSGMSVLRAESLPC